MNVTNYLASLTLVSTDTVTERSDLISCSTGFQSQVFATQDTLALFQVRFEWTDVGLVYIIDDN